MVCFVCLHSKFVDRATLEIERIELATLCGVIRMFRNPLRPLNMGNISHQDHNSKKESKNTRTLQAKKRGHADAEGAAATPAEGAAVEGAVALGAQPRLPALDHALLVEAQVAEDVPVLVLVPGRWSRNPLGVNPPVYTAYFLPTTAKNSTKC